MVYPSKTSIDAWGKLGNAGWYWELMAPYYRKFHTTLPPSDQVSEYLSLDWYDQSLQGTSGPIQTRYNSQYGPLDAAWMQTFKKLDFRNNEDPLSGRCRGGFASSSCVDEKTGTRSHSGSAYYTPEVAKRISLDILTEATVTKIIFAKSADTVLATGVHFVSKDGKSHTVTAFSEIILAAGVFQTPQLLELSGIGSASLLKSHGIEVIIENSQVGENLQDHLQVGMSFEVVDGVQTGDVMRDPQVKGALRTLWEETKSGPLTDGFSTSAMMPVVEFLDTKGQTELIQLLDKYSGGDKDDFPAQKRQYELLRLMLRNPNDASAHFFLAPLQLNATKGPKLSDIYSLDTPGNYVTLSTSLNHPFSRGSVHITSSDPFQKPAVDPRYLSHPLDLEILARHMQYIDTTIAQTEPLASLLKKDGRRTPENARCDDLTSAKQFVTENGFSNYHPSGTCAMMPREMGGVVDSRLIVHGTKNLRIVDASVFPLEPNGNIQSSVYAVAERAADMIRQDAGRGILLGEEEEEVVSV